MLTKWLMAILAFAASCGLGVGSIGLASAYYGSSYTYYLKDPNSSSKAYLTASGNFGGWTGNTFLAYNVRTDIDIYVASSTLACIYTNIDDAWGSPYKEAVNLTLSNTPFYRSVSWGYSVIGGDALFEVAAANSNTVAACNYYSISTDMYNSFVVPHGTTYNNQNNAHDFTTYP